MSQTASDESRTTADRSRNDSEDRDAENDGNAEETPEIEEDLVSEELRIDGICGVY